MKKLCPYCNTEIEYKAKDIEYSDYNGRGICCKFCGEFIEIPRNYMKEYSTSAHKSQYLRSKRRRRKEHYALAYGVLALLFILVAFYIFYVPPWIASPEKLQNSTFIIFDNKTKTDISAEIKLSIYVSKEDIEFERELDICQLLNFEKVIDSVYASNVMVNLIPYEYVWVEINPDNENPIYNTDYGRLVSGMNYEYFFYAYPPINITYLKPYL